eukprot:7721721-Pyramimonas_sp.AAC.1
MAPSRSPADTVWRQSLRGDLAVGDNKHVLSLLGDLKQCYEHVQHPQLVRTAIDWNFPLHSLRFALHTYGWRR